MRRFHIPDFTTSLIPMFAVAAFAAGLMTAGLTDRARAADLPAAEIPPVSDNAALQYWQAFVMMPALTTEQQGYLESWDTVDLGGTVDQLLDASRQSLVFMHRGGMRRTCDWGLDYKDGVSLYLPHLAKAKQLARIAGLKARQELAAGRPEEARHLLGDMLAMARQCGTDLTLVSVLVDYAIENMAIDLAADHFGELAIPYDGAVRAAASLPPAPKLSHTLLGERIMTERFLADMNAAEKRKPGEWRTAWLAIFDEKAPESVKNVKSLAEATALVEGMLPLQQELRGLFDLPAIEFDVKYAEYAKRVASSNELAKYMLPAMEKVSATQRRWEARWAMLLAAAAVVESAPEKLAGLKDPFGEGPFGYKKTDNGFELSSKLQFEEKPVTLKVAMKAK